MTPTGTEPAVPDRDSAAIGRFDTFLFAAVAAVLATRAYLAATGYPQIGGGALHIAHVLWGGLLMAAALIGVAITEGSRSRLIASLAGGIGFGLFIDEIGKFVTSDVDYFFQPAIAMIYAVFVLFYLVVRDVIGRIGLPDHRRIAIASGAVTDLALGRLDDVRRRHVLHILDGVHDDDLTETAAALRRALDVATVPDGNRWSRAQKFLGLAAGRIDTVLGHRTVRRIMLTLFVIQGLGAIVSITVALLVGNTDETDDLSDALVTASTVLSSTLTLVGLWFLVRGHYLRALRTLRAALVVTLLLTQVFLFAQQQLSALTGLVVTLVMLACVRVAIRIEVDATTTEADAVRLPPAADPV